jgi:hypothetical protein
MACKRSRLRSAVLRGPPIGPSRGGTGKPEASEARPDAVASSWTHDVPWPGPAPSLPRAAHPRFCAAV